MQVTIDPQLEKYVEDQVRNGRFQSSTEVMEAGIARLMLDSEPDAPDEADLNDLRTSLAQMRCGEVIEADQVHADISRRFLNE